MTGRPLQQRQIVVAEHAGTQQCTVCHNPHSPRLNLVSASSTAPAGDAAAGKAKAAACVGCHGAEGVSVNLPGPTIAGQRAAYLVDALMEYLTGGRSDPMMKAGVQGLSNGDAANIAAYFSGAKCVSALDAAKQATLQDKATPAKCAACHGADGNSANPSWPNLVGQSKAYLATALKAYKSGARKNGMMSGVTKGLNDADIENAAAYYANATCK
jgi:cytochrome c553